MIFSDFHVHTAHDHGRAMPAEMAAEAARMEPIRQYFLRAARHAQANKPKLK